MKPLSLEAVQLQCDGVETITRPVSGPEATVTASGDTTYGQPPSDPSWVMVTARPAMTTMPVRVELEVLASARTVTVPFPVPDSPAVT
jgi:hypothetical protein